MQCLATVKFLFTRGGMSTEETDKATDASGGDEEEWLYGDESEEKVEDEAPNGSVKCDSEKPQPPAEEVHEIKDVKQDSGQEDEESDSEDDDNDVCVTIGAITTGGLCQSFSAFGSTPVNLNIKTAGRTHASAGPKPKGLDLDAQGNVNGIPVLEVDLETLEEKPWRRPGSDLSDYFNYGFNEDTWKAYCEKQKRLRMGYDGINHSASAAKIMVHQGRSSLGDGALPCFRSDYSSPSKPASSRKSSSTIDVIGGQTGTISRVEGRRRHSVDGNNIQVLSEPSSDADPTPTKISPFYHPNIPPPPFLPPSHNVSSAPPLIPPPRIPISIPPPGYPPGAPPPSLIPSLDCGRSGGYDGRSAPVYPPFPPGVYPPPPPPPPGSTTASWAGVFDSAKAWEYYARRDSERERHKERDRTRDRGHDKDREREHSPSAQACSDEERRRRRDSGERGYERHHHHRDRTTRDNEDRHREKRHRDKEERRYKSSRSSRRRHDSEEGDSHPRHKHKKAKRSRDDKEPSQELSADQENQSEPTE
ncbi:pre-mRNA 3'-end-processing factor FIP1 isoform X2 [Esox lucius]|nr:pre-mRNA 3'-end-processing factor FIP1 isoform X2 [Esox lucius]